MKRLILCALALVSASGMLSAQQVIRLYDGVAPGSEGVENNERVELDAKGNVNIISNVSDPSVTVFLPSKEKATGTAVILCAGGGLMSHSWGNDVLNMAAWLNERGVAAIGLKYRTRVFPPRPQGGQGAHQGQRPQAGQGGAPAMMLSASITEFEKIKNANANPDPSQGNAPSIMNPVNDALRAMEIVKENAAAWNIDPAKIGYLGFSAGGGVALGEIMHADEFHMPAFMATIYGPSLMDVKVPENAPTLFIATRGDHHNVAAGLVALYMEWKKAGKKAEMHIYEDGTGPFGPDDIGNTSGTWRESFYRWLTFNGF
ncbi:MAG: alpha/beta hydrolase fold domain-containing protein [Bacteroidales bacterium]|nr:alpha/beta hydrolase fold domain-containing protein [Candidatus Cryptobacteroides caccocaballi]